MLQELLSGFRRPRGRVPGVSDPTLCLLARGLIADVRRWWDRHGSGPPGAERADLLDLLSLAILEADAMWTLLPEVAGGTLSGARVYVRRPCRVPTMILVRQGRSFYLPKGSSGLFRVFTISSVGTWVWVSQGLAQAAQGRPEVFGLQAAVAFIAAALLALTFPLLIGRVGSMVACRAGVTLVAVGAALPLLSPESLLAAGVGAFAASLGTWSAYLPLKGILYRNLPFASRPWVPTAFDAGTILALAAAGVSASFAPLAPEVLAAMTTLPAVALIGVSWSAGGFFGGTAAGSSTRSASLSASFAGGWAMLPFAAAFALIGGIAEASPAVAAAASARWGTVAAVGMGVGTVAAPVLALLLSRRPSLIRLAAVAALALYLLPLSPLVVLLAASATMAASQAGFLLGDLAASRRDDGSGAAFSGASAAWYLAAAPATPLAAVQMPAVWLLALAAITVILLPLRLISALLTDSPPGR